MAKITRKLMKIFGVNATTQQRGVFGSLAAGSPAYSTDPEVIQSLANYESGWFSAVLGNNSPAIQDMNALQFVFAYQLAYLMQSGIPEWNSATTYYIGSLVTDVGTGVIYASRTNDNLNNAVSDNTNWRIVGGNIMTASGDLIYGGTNGNQTRLAAGSSGQFLGMNGSPLPVWTSFIAPTVQFFTSGSGTYNKNYAFTIASGSATVGATYTNNGVTYTVYETVASGTLIYMSGNGAPTASGTLTKASGTGDATLTFSQARAPLYLVVEVQGGGGGGGGTSTAGGTGGTTTFGSSLLTVTGGSGGANTGGGSGVGGTGGTATVNSPARLIYSRPGGTGGGSTGVAAGVGGGGGSSYFSGQGVVSSAAAGLSGDNGIANTGGGGAGVNSSGGANTGRGGGGGAYAKALLANPSATYAYAVGAAGTAGSGNGSAGGAGVIIVWEHYQ